MHKFKFFIGMAFLLAFSSICFAQDAQQAGSDQAEIPGDSPPATPVMPDAVTYESSAGNVLFPHSTHLKFGCAACHHQIHASVLDTPHPDYLKSSWINCQDCHDTKSETSSNYYKCSDCHHADPEDISDETLSSKVVIHQSCWKCHKSGTGAKASEGCGDCHVKEED